VGSANHMGWLSPDQHPSYEGDSVGNVGVIVIKPIVDGFTAYFQSL
jgi:hypothetical protein